MARIGKQLLKEGKITGKQLDEALKKQQQQPSLRIGSHLILIKALSTRELAETLGETYQCKWTDLIDTSPTPEALALVPQVFSEAHHVLPLERRGASLSIAVCDPTNSRLLSRLTTLTHCQIEAVICPQIAIDQMVEEAYTTQTIPQNPPKPVPKVSSPLVASWENPELMAKIRQAKSKKRRIPVPRQIHRYQNPLLKKILAVSLIIHGLFGGWMMSIYLPPRNVDIVVVPKEIAIEGFFPEKVNLLPSEEPIPIEEKTSEPNPPSKKPNDTSNDETAPQLENLPRESKPNPAPVGQPDGTPDGASAQPEVGGGDGQEAEGVDVGRTGVLGLLSGKGDGNKKTAVSNAERDVDRVLQQGGQLVTGAEVAGSPTGIGSGLKGEGYARTGVQTGTVQSVRLGKRGTVSPNAITSISGTGTGQTGRSQDEIRQRVAAYLVAIQNLYEEQLKVSPALAGQLVVEFTILANGKTTNCQIVKSTLRHPEFESQVVNRVKRWRFSPIADGDVDVIYPFQFSTI